MTVCRCCFCHMPPRYHSCHLHAVPVHYRPRGVTPLLIGFADVFGHSQRGPLTLSVRVGNKNHQFRTVARAGLADLDPFVSSTYIPHAAFPGIPNIRYFRLKIVALHATVSSKPGSLRSGQSVCHLMIATWYPKNQRSSGYPLDGSFYQPLGIRAPRLSSSANVLWVRLPRGSIQPLWPPNALGCIPPRHATDNNQTTHRAAKASVRGRDVSVVRRSTRRPAHFYRRRTDAPTRYGSLLPHNFLWALTGHGIFSADKTGRHQFSQPHQPRESEVLI